LSRKRKLHFRYSKRRHPVSDELLYGASVKNGLIMQKACARIPMSARVNSGPALFGLSWDAANASRRRSYTPILISVGNSDYGGREMCICIGFLPTLPLSAKELATDEGKQALHELRQACAGAILDIIERCAQTGFKCKLFKDGAPCEWHLFPFLTRMEFDTKERYKFFGCARQRACGIGSGPRQGRSCIRPCTPHSLRPDLQQQLLICSGEAVRATPFIFMQYNDVILA
jgi:hypothetical protein